MKYLIDLKKGEEFLFRKSILFLLSLTLSTPIFNFAMADLEPWSEEVDTILINDHRLDKTREFAERIYNKYSPKEYVVVGMGRTAGVTGEWLSELSGKENYYIDSPVENMQALSRYQTSQTDEAWKAIFPSKEELGGRKLVVHRFLWAGHTMERSMSSMMGYLERNGYPMPVEFDFPHSNDEKGLSVYKFIDKNPQFKNKVQLNFYKNSGQVYDSFTDDLDFDSAGKSKFIDYGKNKAESMVQLINGKKFKSNPNYSTLKQVIESSSCLEFYDNL